MITAHLSEPPPSLAARRDDLPAVVDRVLASAMAKSPDGRYATCAQFATDLGRSLGLVPGAPEPPGMPQHAGPGAGGPAWPAAGLAGGIPGPDAMPAQHLAPGGQRNVRSPQDRPGAPPPAGYQQGAGLTRGPRPTAIYGGPPGDAGGAWPPGPGEPGWEQPAPARRSRGKIAAVADRRGSRRGGGRGHSSRQPSQQPAGCTRRSRVRFFLLLRRRRIVVAVTVVVAVSLTGTVIAVGPGTIGKRRSHRRQQCAGVR